MRAEWAFPGANESYASILKGGMGVNDDGSMILRRIFFIALAFVLCGSPAESLEPPSSETNPIVLGVDTAGSYLLGRFPNQTNAEDIAFWSHEPFYRAIEDLGAGYVMVHLFPDVVFGEENAARMAQKLIDIDAGMLAHGLLYSLNTEISNFENTAEVTPGANEFETPDGMHRWDIRMEWIEPLLASTRPAAAGLLGVIYDEPALTQIGNNQGANNPLPPLNPLNEFEQPYLAGTHGLALTDAFDAIVEACRRLRAVHYQGRVPLFAEQVIPDMYPIFARAGWTLTPKLLTQELTAVNLAIGLGAAVQYADRGGDFWGCVDLWNLGVYPGHSLEALRSALLMGYWLGVTGLYVENLDFTWDGPRHRDADGPGGLIRWLDTENYEITAHGRVVQDFFKNYVPANRRTVDWRRYRPRVAIVRLPDGSVGQPDVPWLRPWMLGARDAPMDEISREWLDVWPILTHGAARPGSIVTFNFELYPGGISEFFTPIDSVAVFDHLVEGPVLDSVECFVVTGHALSAPTFAAIAERVAGGATAIIARRLIDLHAPQTPPGRWVVVDSFADPEVEAAIAPFLGPPDVARFRFEDQTIEFRRGEAPDSITARILISAHVLIEEILLGLSPETPEADLNGDGRVDVADLLAARRQEAGSE